MSALNTTSNIAGATPAARALRQADDGIGGWLKDLVTGAGSSPSHIIVTGILGVVPGVGQVMDARDLILGVIQIIRSPMAIMAWVELVITLIGCIPAVGDALKVAFKLMKQGKNFGRVLEAVSPTLRGNVERYMRKIDWSMLANECKGTFHKALAAFIDGIDSWMVKAVAGGPQVKLLLDELKAVQKLGPKMIDDAIGELKTMYTRMITHELPSSTAAVAGVTGKKATREANEAFGEAATAAQKQAVRTERKLVRSKSRDAKANRVSPNATTTNKKKAGQPKKQKWRTGIPAEHLTDYYVKGKHKNFRKANNFGKLTEEYSTGHPGLDHLWSNKTHRTKPFIVGETKSSIFDSFKFASALPADLREKIAAIRADEAANPVKSGKPNIFDSSERDKHSNKRVRVDSENEEAVRGGLNKAGVDKEGVATGLYHQMSHKWIMRAVTLPSANLTSAGTPIIAAARDFNDDIGPCPYQRWIAMVTGRQLSKHAKAKGAVHDIQLMLDLPENILDK